ncbi:MAG: Uma2 family endonuclease [Cyanothece sp. SIO1E1]|nr:Uma2 family endonuclease [Cyanothece sp. SIO1E1]
MFIYPRFQRKIIILSALLWVVFAIALVANVFPLAPDWTIEILSPDPNQTKVTKNILHCLRYGTQLGLLIDPNEQTVFVYRPGHQTEVFDQPDAKLPVPAFVSDLQLTVGDLFAWLSE